MRTRTPIYYPSYAPDVCEIHAGEPKVKFRKEWLCRSCFFDAFPIDEPGAERRWEMWVNRLMNRAGRR